MTPNAEVMDEFVSALFGNQLRGQVELAHSGAGDRRLRYAELFHLDNLDALVEKAVAVNAIEGQNVYVGAAIRKPDAPSGRCRDQDVLCSTAFWADLDAAGAVKTARPKSGPVPANIGVITGRTPHPRAQLYWLQLETITDMEMLRRQNAAIATALGGDPSVTNPARLMRLPGSVAWPSKPGRIAEMTELLTFPDRPAVYAPGQVAAAFPASMSIKISETLGTPPEDWVELLQNGSGEGGRNQAAAKLAGYLFRRALNPKIVYELLRCVNETRFDPPLDDDELLGVFESIAKAELRRRGAAA